MIGLPLETERLVIRPFEPERDAEPLHELWGDAEAMQFVPSGPRASVDQTRELLKSLSGRAPEGLGSGHSKSAVAEGSSAASASFPWLGKDLSSSSPTTSSRQRGSRCGGTSPRGG